MLISEHKDFGFISNTSFALEITKYLIIIGR